MYLLDAVVRRVPDGAWANPSCCTGWTARQVAGHAAWYVKGIGSLAAGAGPIAAEDEWRLRRSCRRRRYGPVAEFIAFTGRTPVRGAGLGE